MSEKNNLSFKSEYSDVFDDKELAAKKFSEEK